MSGTATTYNALMANAQKPLLKARRVLPAGEWITEREAFERIERLNPVKPPAHPMIQVEVGTRTLPGSGSVPVTESVPDPGWVPQAPTYAFARGELEIFFHFGIVERRHNPRTPRQPDVRLKTDEEMAAWIETIEAARRRGGETFVDVNDADGNLHNVPREEADDYRRKVIEEVRRRQALNLQAKLDAQPMPYPQNGLGGF